MAKSELELLQEHVEHLKSKIKELEKTINQKNRKITKLRMQKALMAEEIDELDTYEPEIVEPKREEGCPRCGAALKFTYSGSPSVGDVITCTREGCMHTGTRRS